MKFIKSLLILFFAFVAYSSAQTSQDFAERDSIVIQSFSYSKVGFLNSNTILNEMSERKKATEQVEDLNKKYKDELQGMQNDYRKKYSDYISYQGSMADNIRLRRMQELYELERHINQFMEIAQKDVEAKEKELMTPIRQKLKKAIEEVGVEQSLVCVYDLANPTIVFVTPEGTEITTLVKRKLGIK